MKSQKEDFRKSGKFYGVLIILGACLHAAIFYPLLFNEHVHTIRNEADRSLSGYFSRYLSLFYQTPPPETFMNTSEVIRNRGYQVEEHKVTTEDGYIITMFRIPRGKFEKDSKGKSVKEPVVIHHGMTGSSDHWIILPSDESLAFTLADAGKDVWIPSLRGTEYSSEHLHLSSDDIKYWDFSLDELGEFDVPAMVNYILKTSKAPKLSWIGYSMGAGLFFVGLNKHPQLHDKIHKMVALSPGVYITPEAPQSFKMFATLSSDRTRKIINMLNNGRAISPRVSSWMKSYLPYICSGKLTARICHLMYYITGGHNWNGFHDDLTSVLAAHTFSETSGKIMIQAGQYITSGRFQAFDHGPEENSRRYNSPTPTIYQVANVKVRSILIYAPKDCIILVPTAKRIASELQNLEELIEVPDPNFEHSDFIMGKNASKLVYKKVIQFLSQP